jgi:hypothetical protein
LQGLSWRSPQKRAQAQKRPLKMIFIKSGLPVNLLKLQFFIAFQ